MSEQQPQKAQGLLQRLTALWHTLPVRLLAVTIFGVLFAEIVIFVPSVSNHRVQLLQQRIDAAHLATITIQLAPREMITPEKVKEIFGNAQILGVGIFRDGRSQLVLAPELDASLSDDLVFVDLKNDMPFALVGDALAMMFSKDNPYLLVQGEPTNMQGVLVETVIQRRPMRLELWRYARSILWLSLFICLFVATILYVSLMALFVRPMVKLTQNMAEFQQHPEDASRLLTPSKRRDEIGDAERVLANMQKELRHSLKQREKLATLGEGVSKISHDLRNVLASAVLMSDRMTASDDPRVQKLAPRLVQALDRAVLLARATLDYGRMQEMQKEPVNLFDIVEEVDDSLRPLLAEEPIIHLDNQVSPDISITVDQIHFFRAMANLMRNAVEALRNAQTQHGKVSVSVESDATRLNIRIMDNGPGIPGEAQENLFIPFKGSNRKGGTGLGLAIAHETIAAHGGSLTLEKTDPTGTVFLISLPL